MISNWKQKQKRLMPGTVLSAQRIDRAPSTMCRHCLMCVLDHCSSHRHRHRRTHIPAICTRRIYLSGDLLSQAKARAHTSYIDEFLIWVFVCVCVFDMFLFAFQTIWYANIASFKRFAPHKMHRHRHGLLMNPTCCWKKMTSYKFRHRSMPHFYRFTNPGYPLFCWVHNCNHICKYKHFWKIYLVHRNVAALWL